MRRVINTLMTITSIMAISVLEVSCTLQGKYDKDVIGIDVSHHNGKINWKMVKDAGVDFVYIKATEGATYTDPKFSTYSRGAKDIGLKVGVYHFFRMTSSVSAQLCNFKSALSELESDLCPMVDVEISDGRPVSEVRDSLKKFLSMIESEYNVTPMIYATNRSFNELCWNEFERFPKYIGRYGNDVPVITGKSHYTVWQYSETGDINGIEKKVDLCRFHPDCGLEDIVWEERPLVEVVSLGKKGKQTHSNPCHPMETVKNTIAAIIVALRHRPPATHGIDVSHRQGDIDWGKVSKDSGEIEFVYVKATEGTTYFDPKFEDNIKGAHNAGLHAGPYHFFRMTSTTHEQFNSFNKCITRCRQYIDILPVVDVETFDGKSAVQVKDSLDKFIRLIHDEYDIYPIIYGPSIAPDRMMSKFACENCMFFLGQTETTEPKQKYDIWQYTCRARVDGISTNVDMEKLHEGLSISKLLWNSLTIQ